MKDKQLKEKQSFDSLLNESLGNAKHDRKLALDAFDQMKKIFEVIDTEKAESLQSVLLVGANAVKLLEQSSRSNQQIIHLAQLKEKEERAKEKDDNEDGYKLTLEDIQKASANEK